MSSHKSGDSAGSSNGSVVCLADLQRRGIRELEQLCAERHIDRPQAHARPDLVLALLNDYASKAHRIEGSGVLEVLPDGFGFLRSSMYSYTPGPDDVYVSPAQIRRFQLRTGHQVAGELRPPKGTEKYFALVRVEAIEEDHPEDCPDVLPFDALEPELPSEPLASGVELLSDLRKGDRALVVADPHGPVTRFVAQAAQGIGTANPEANVLVLQIDQRPEQVTWLARDLGHQHDLVSSTFDETSARHVHTAQIAHERCRRLVEHGHDVVILLDSLTALARALDIESAPSGRLAPGGLDALGVVRAKRLLASARAVAGGGSLTIVAIAHDGKGSRVDAAVLEAFFKHASLVVELP